MKVYNVKGFHPDGAYNKNDSTVLKRWLPDGYGIKKMTSKVCDSQNKTSRFNHFMAILLDIISLDLITCNSLDITWWHFCQDILEFIFISC